MAKEAKTAWLFEGQGSQYPGMGQAAFDKHGGIVRILYLLGESITGVPLRDLSFYGSETELLKTRNAQLAIYTHSAALLGLARELRLPGFDRVADHMAGNSLGEFNAYQAAGAYSFTQGLRIVDGRATGMSIACEQNPGGLLPTRIDPTDQVRVQEVLREYSLERAVNSPGQTLFGGPRSNLLLLAQALNPERPTELLATEGAFHTSFMKPAEPFLESAYKKVKVLPIDRRTSVWANSTAEVVRSPEQVFRASMDQLTQTVLWADTLNKMMDAGVTDFYEIGTKRLFAAMLRRMASARGSKVATSDIMTDKDVQVATRVQLLDAA